MLRCVKALILLRYKFYFALDDTYAGTRQYRGNKLATILVNTLTLEVLNRGYIPYYSTRRVRGIDNKDVSLDFTGFVGLHQSCLL